MISDSQTAASSSTSSSSSSVLSFVSTVWDNVRYTKSLTGVDLQFVRVRRQDNMTMDTLLEGIRTESPLFVCIIMHRPGGDAQTLGIIDDRWTGRELWQPTAGFMT